MSTDSVEQSRPVIGPHSAILERRWRGSAQHAVVLDDHHLVHYRRKLGRPDQPWQRLATITDDAEAPAEIRLVAAVLTVRVREVTGSAIYQRQGAVWQRVEDAVWPTSQVPQRQVSGEPDLVSQLQSPAVLAPLSRTTTVVGEGESVFSYHRRRDGVWLRSACLRVIDADVTAAGASSVKLAQITGEWDATPAPDGTRRASLSRSLSTAGIRGTDLGVSIEHQGRRFLLFGDTHWTRPWLVTRDSIAEVFDAEPLPEVRFHGSPLRVSGATMREYDVPLDAVSVAAGCYGFFTSHHFRHGLTMGRSVLAKLRAPQLLIDPGVRRQPVDFTGLTTISERYFINISAQIRPARDVPGAEDCGGAGSGDVVLLWGTGSYRASELRLAMLPVEALPESRTDRLELRYWDGAGWSDTEAAAAPLFSPAALGEISVRWLPEVGRYLLLAMSGPEDPAGATVTARWADNPAGPWTPRLALMDWVQVGMIDDSQRRFIKAHADDPVAENLFSPQSRGLGGAYAPYFYDARRDGADLVLRYTLSTWNPYQVVLMEHRLHPGEF